MSPSSKGVQGERLLPLTAAHFLHCIYFDLNSVGGSAGSQKAAVLPGRFPPVFLLGALVTGASHPTFGGCMFDVNVLAITLIYLFVCLNKITNMRLQGLPSY